MATCSSILAWEIPWTEEPGGLQSMGHRESGSADQLSIQHSTNYSSAKYIMWWLGRGCVISILHSTITDERIKRLIKQIKSLSHRMGESILVSHLS